jgi:hypothetical protein
MIRWSRHEERPSKRESRDLQKLLWMPNPLPTNFIKRVFQIYVEQSPFLNEIDLHPHNSSHLESTIKLIRRTSSTINQLLGLIYAPAAASVAMSIAASVATLSLNPSAPIRYRQRFAIIIDWVFCIYSTSPIGLILIDKRTNFDFGQSWANLDPISMKYQVVYLIDQLLAVFRPL